MPRPITVKALLKEINRERWDRKGVRVLAKTDSRVFDVTAIKIEDDVLVLIIEDKETRELR